MSYRGGSITPAGHIDVARRRKFVLEKVGAGATYQEAADAVLAEGLAPRTRRRPDGSTEPRYRRQDAQHDCDIAMKQLTDEPAKRVKARHLHRLDTAQRKMMVDVAECTEPMDRARAAAALVQLLNREARLLGLDEPVRTELEITAHLDRTANIAIAAMLAGAALADLSDEQRAQMLAGARGYLADAVPRQALLAPVIDIEDAGEGA